ncbi:hypothetical protein PUN28_018153 [Cardiocondyla obscurior]|uniref:Uncharacterized protein n=1 Tax=Cardiocondyla obscurior TaxID=286306 RepID=A0AAW2EJY3_9HYME
MPRARAVGPAREQRTARKSGGTGERQSDKRKVAPRLLRALSRLLDYIAVARRDRYGTGCDPTRTQYARTCARVARAHRRARTIRGLRRTLSGNSSSYMYIYNIIVDTNLSSSEERKKTPRHQGRRDRSGIMSEGTRVKKKKDAQVTGRVKGVSAGVCTARELRSSATFSLGLSFSSDRVFNFN